MSAKQISVNVVIVLFLVSLACWGFTLFSGGDTDVRVGTDNTMGTIKQQQQEIILEFGDIGYEIEITERSIRAADQAVTDSQEQAKGIASGITECQKLVKECRTLADENRKILESVGSGTGIRTPATKEARN